MAFDCTYLQNGLNQMELHGEHLLVGGIYTPAHPDNAVLKLNRELDVKKAKKSDQMLTFLTWDPNCHQKLPLSMAEIPVEQNFKGPMASQRASYYVLELVGRVLAASDGAVKAVVFDAATAHRTLRKVMFGIDAACMDNSLQEIPWFRDLTYKTLPSTMLPRMPIKLAFMQDEAVWALPGACLLFNIATAMCLAPLVHQQMTLQQRCEIGIAGFLSMDLFALLSRDWEKRLRLPAGSGFMAKQTREVLQACSLAGVLVCISKDEYMEPFKRGFMRLTEISIEQYFGMLRTQHANAQMSARSFFHSSARQQMRQNKDLFKQKAPKTDGDKPLTQREQLGSHIQQLDAGMYQWCAKRAWDSTLAWVAAVCSRNVEQLENEYREACADGLFDSSGALGSAPGELDPDEAEDDWQSPAPQPGKTSEKSENPCLDLLKQVASEAQSFVGAAEVEEPAVDEQPSDKPDHGKDLDGVPDRSQLERLTEAKNNAEPFGTEAFGSPGRDKDKDHNYLPKTLSDLLTLKGDFWNKLLRYNEHLLKQLRLEQDDDESGHVVVMKLPGLRNTAGVDIGLVTTVWRGVKQPKPSAKEVPINGCEPPTDWVCNGKSTAHVLRLESLVCILDVDGSEEPHSTTGSFKVKLTRESAAVLHKLDGLELWTVGHTMQRGQNRVLGGDPTEQPDFSGKKEVAPKKKAIKRKRKGDDSALDVAQVHPDQIRRTNAGRALIQKMLKYLQLRDDAEFPSSPMFDMKGFCRLKLAGAQEYTWDQMLEISPEVIDCMCLGWEIEATVSRYRLVKSPQQYGEAVFKHLEGIRSQLSRTPPCRTGYQQLMKEILDYLQLVGHKQKKDHKSTPEVSA
eukprot:s1066_g10.t1